MGTVIPTIRRRSSLVRRLPIALPHELIDGCKLWLAGDQITGVANGGTITTWPDVSPIGNVVTQATSGSRPTFSIAAINGLPAVYFDDTGRHFTFTSLPLTGYTIFAVYDLLSLTRAAHYLLGGSGQGVHGGGIYSGLNGWGLYDGSIQVLASEEPTNVWTLMAWQNTKLFRNGVEATYSASGTSAGITLSIVGRRETSWADGYFRGYAAEIIVFGVTLNDYHRKTMEAYLANKYGLSISA